MKILGFLLLISLTVSITIELNNIHNGYRNVYKGTVRMEEPKIHLKPFVLIRLSKELVKNELEEKDTKSISILGDEVSIDMNKYVRQYYLEDIDPSSPINLIFRFYDSTHVNIKDLHSF